MKKFLNKSLHNLKKVKWWKYLLLFLQELFIFLCLVAMNTEEFSSSLFAYTFVANGYEFNLGVMFMFALFTIGIWILFYLFFYVPWRLIFDSMLKDMKNDKS